MNEHIQTIDLSISNRNVIHYSVLDEHYAQISKVHYHLYAILSRVDLNYYP